MAAVSGADLGRGWDAKKVAAAIASSNDLATAASPCATNIQCTEQLSYASACSHSFIFFCEKMKSVVPLYQMLVACLPSASWQKDFFFPCSENYLYHREKSLKSRRDSVCILSCESHLFIHKTWPKLWSLWVFTKSWFWASNFTGSLPKQRLDKHSESGPLLSTHP